MRSITLCGLCFGLAGVMLILCRSSHLVGVIMKMLAMEAANWVLRFVFAVLVLVLAKEFLFTCLS